ncbi:MAG TPA: 4Fe-4S binding protein [Thermodesulfobacteriota bacterium]|nr:4Fe-4S binding protein [Thermodesulfobacteriota bacterium]
MKHLTIISGKGGTGKTTITAALASLATNHVMVDADVDAADLHLILNPSVLREEPFYGGQVPVLDNEHCTECGLCMESCRFDAIKNASKRFSIDYLACEGCGFCVHVCPVQAITMQEHRCGTWFISETRFGPLVHAQLGIAEENSGKLVHVVRQQARSLGEEKGKDLIIIDGPPGIGCPVIASITGVDLVLVVTEPTLSGIHDLQRVVGVARHFNVPAIVCVNKADISPENTDMIRQFCAANGLEIATEIPYEPLVTKAMVAGQTVIEYRPDVMISSKIRMLWETIRKALA